MATFQSSLVRCVYFAMLSIVALTFPVQAQDELIIETDEILVTIVLKHQQDKNLSELQEKMDTNKFWQSFPPEGIEIDSWYVAMGLGQVIVVKVLPKDLRRLNIALESSAWGIFDTEIYPTYEFEEIAAGIKQQKLDQETEDQQ